jgi:uncharacterized protein (DUF2336 family)
MSIKSADAITLTQHDVDELMRSDSPDARITVLEKVSEGYNAAVFAAREQEIAEHIFRLLMKDAALRVREILADRVQHNAVVPHDIVRHLAEDTPSVSLPILEHSKVLSDADLVHIVENSRELSKLHAIAGREEVSGRVSDALVETNYPQVVSTLLNNDTAEISERTLGRIVSDFNREAAVMDAMVSRSGLPIAVVEHIISRASDEVAAQLKEKYDISAEEAARDSAGTREQATLQLLATHPSHEEIEQLAAQMVAESRLTPSIAMTALCRGYLQFFYAAMGQLANVKTSNVKTLLADKGGLGFNALYTRSGLPESMSSAVRVLVQVGQTLEAEGVKPGSGAYANNAVERLMAIAQEDTIENLPYLMALIRQQ